MRRNILARATFTALISCALVATPTIAANATEQPDADYVYEVGYYVYKKVDPNKPASWENSGKQTLITVQPGTDWLTTPTLPDWVCGTGWGYQQDKVKHDGSLVFPKNITYPDDSGMGWPPIYEAKHGELSTSACEPPPTPFSDTGETFTCDYWTYWTRTGHYEHTFDVVANVWTDAAEPTIDKETSEQTPTTYDERVARGCEPELAETGVNDNAWLFAGGGLLLLVAGASLVTYRKRKEAK